MNVNIIKNTESSSIVLYWDEVNDFVHTTYTIVWGGGNQTSIVEDPVTSYTITGLTLDTVYTITIYPANECGSGPEYTTSITFPAGIISTYVVSYISSY